ncbi:hypothetical protein [Exiguobacterium undae]|uniref:hypothetical protein n=1 Tax=Exiguobacterium undae TaxID=169177 RepID=UPI00384E5204
MIVLPEKAYKYMDPKWLRHLKKTGEVRISPLNSYEEAKFGAEVGDDFEGRTSLQVSVGRYESSKENDNDRLLRMAGIQTVNSKVIMENCTIVNHHEDSNYFVYCVCLDRGSDIQKSFGSGIQIIHNFPAYIRAITRELNKIGIVLHDAGACEYIIDRRQHFTEEDFTPDKKELILKKPYLIKEKRYEYQNEFRVVWRYSNNEKISAPKYPKIKKEDIEDYSYLIDLEEQERNKKKRKRKKK